MRAVSRFGTVHSARNTMVDKTDGDTDLIEITTQSLAHNWFLKTFVKWINQGSFIHMDTCITLSNNSTENGGGVFPQRW